MLYIVGVIYYDVTLYNFMLNASFNLYIADFAGSLFARSISTIVARLRF